MVLPWQERSDKGSARKREFSHRRVQADVQDRKGIGSVLGTEGVCFSFLLVFVLPKQVSCGDPDHMCIQRSSK